MSREHVCFVMMPIKSAEERPRWRRVLDDIIRPAVLSSGMPFRVERVDDLPGTGNWLARVVECTAEADLVVADLTEANPNVMWELGLRHASARSGTVMIAQSLDHVPSDLRSYGVIEYRPDGSDLHQFSARMANAIDHVMSGKSVVDSPYFEFLGVTQAIRRDLAAHLRIEGTVVADSFVPVAVSGLPGAKPTLTPDEFRKQHSLAQTVFQGTPDAFEYSLEIDEMADDYCKALQDDWEARLHDLRALRLDLSIQNHGQVPAEDVEVQVSGSWQGAARLLHLLPGRIAIPSLPPRPTLTGFPEEEAPYCDPPPLGHAFSRVGLIEAQTVPPTSADESGNFVFTIGSIRQASACEVLTPLFLVPGDDFEGGILRVALRCRNIRGVVTSEFTFVRATSA